MFRFYLRLAVRITLVGLGTALVLLALAPVYTFLVNGSKPIAIQIEGLKPLRGDAYRENGAWHVTGAEKSFVLGGRFPQGIDTQGLGNFHFKLKATGTSPTVDLLWGGLGAKSPQIKRIGQTTTVTISPNTLQDWPSRLGMLGIGLEGGDIEGVKIEAIEFQKEFSFGAIYREITRDWFSTGRWQHRSINAVEFGKAAYLSSPLSLSITVVTALWGLMTLTLLLILRTRLGIASLSPVLLLPLAAAWFLQDLRWQWELIGRGKATMDAYASKAPKEGILEPEFSEDFAALIAATKSALRLEDRLVVISASAFDRDYTRFMLSPQPALTNQDLEVKILRTLSPGAGVLTIGSHPVSVLHLPAASQLKSKANLARSVRTPTIEQPPVIYGDSGEPLADAQKNSMSLLVAKSRSPLRAGYYRATFRVNVPAGKSHRVWLEVAPAGQNSPSSYSPISRREVMLQPGVTRNYSITFQVLSPVSVKYLVRRGVNRIPHGTAVQTVTLTRLAATSDLVAIRGSDQGVARVAKIILSNRMGTLFIVQ